ncbi:MAG: YIP1 family protein [Thermoanaerobaculia bacterium]|nr:YIP1 family protein [Thermoanaerobaculia bacterium]
MEDSSFGRVLGVLVAPNKTFASIAKRPTWVVAFLVLMITSLAATVVINPKIDMEEVVRTSVMESNPDVTDAEIDMGVKVAEVLRWFGLVFVPIFYLLAAAVLMVCFRLAGGEIDFRTSWATSLYAWMPMTVSALLIIPVVMGKSEIPYEVVESGKFLSSHLGVLAPEGASKALKALLSSFDFFTIWTLATMSIGYKHTARVSMATSASIITGLWLVMVAIKVGFALL